MIKNCYLLCTNKGLLEEKGYSNLDQTNDLYGFVDEDYTSKREYIKAAKAYTTDFNKKHNTNFTYQEIFGEPEDIGYRLCTECGQTFWKYDVEHECDERR